MVCVGECLCDDVPGFVPAYAVFVDQDAHQFRNRNNGVRVVQLDYVKLGELAEIRSVVGHKVVDQVLQAGAREEVLLL